MAGIVSPEFLEIIDAAGTQVGAVVFGVGVCRCEEWLAFDVEANNKCGVSKAKLTHCFGKYNACAPGEEHGLVAGCVNYFREKVFFDRKRKFKDEMSASVFETMVQ